MLLSSDRDVSKILKMKRILVLKIAKVDLRGQFWATKSDSTHKTHFVNGKSIFGGGGGGGVSKFHDLFNS